MTQPRDPRVHDLLADRALFGLDDAEARELAARGADGDDSYDLAAAAVELATLPVEPMPAGLADRIADRIPAGRHPRTLAGWQMAAPVPPPAAAPPPGSILQAAEPKGMVVPSNPMPPPAEPPPGAPPPFSAPGGMVRPSVKPPVLPPEASPHTSRSAIASHDSIPWAEDAGLPMATVVPSTTLPRLPPEASPPAEGLVPRTMVSASMPPPVMPPAAAHAPAMARPWGGAVPSPDSIPWRDEPGVPRRPPYDPAPDSIPWPDAADATIKPTGRPPYDPSPPTVPVVPTPRRRRAALPWLAAAATLVLVAGGWWLLRGRAPRPPTAAEARAELLAGGGDVARIDWKATPEAPGASGDVVWSPSAQRGFLRFVGLPANDPAKTQYQLWIFDRGRDQAFPVDGGVFDVASTGEVIVPITAKLRVDDAALFAVTVERPGGVVVSRREHIVVTAARS